MSKLPVKKFQFYWPFLILLPAVLLLFWPALFHPTHVLHPTFSPYSDTMLIHWPKARLMAQNWQMGQSLSLWTPLILSGMPLAANQLAMLFYPPAWLFLFLPSEPVFNLLFVFHLLFGGWGIFLFLHEGHNRSVRAALLAALTFTLNGKWLAHVAGGHVSMVAAIGWMPWVLLATLKLLTAPTAAQSWIWSLFGALVLALQITTHTLPVIYSFYLIGAMALWHVTFMSTRRWQTVKQLLLPLLAMPLLAGLVGAVQLLPLAELSQFSNRALSLDQAAEYALSPAQLLVGLLLPSAQAGHEYVIYLGLVPLLLAPLGVTRQNRWTWFYGLLFVFSLLFALGTYTPVHSLFYYLAPGFGWVRTPARMFFVGAMALAVLVGFAVDRLPRATWSPRAKRWFTRLTLVIGGPALLLGLGLALGFGVAQRAAWALAIFVPLGLSLILLAVKRAISPQLSMTLLGVLLVLDLAWFDASMMRFVPLAEALAPGRAAAVYLAQNPGLFRVYSPSYSLPMATAAAAGLQLADGVEPVHLAAYDQYMARAGGYNNAGFSVTIPNFNGGDPATALQNTQPNLSLLGLLNVTHVAANYPMDWPGLTLDAEIDGTYLYRNQKTLPRAWIAYQTTSANADWLAQLETQPNPAQTVLLADDVRQRYPNLISTGLPPGTVNIISYTANRLELTTTSAAPGWLVLSEVWYPGWQAAGNGAPLPVEKVNGLLRGIYLAEPGNYEVSLVYRPRSVVWGGWISVVSLGIVLLAGGVLLYQTRRAA